MTEAMVKSITIQQKKPQTISSNNDMVVHRLKTVLK